MRRKICLSIIVILLFAFILITLYLGSLVALDVPIAYERNLEISFTKDDNLPELIEETYFRNRADYRYVETLIIDDATYVIFDADLPEIFEGAYRLKCFILHPDKESYVITIFGNPRSINAVMDSRFGIDWSRDEYLFVK